MKNIKVIAFLVFLAVLTSCSINSGEENYEESKTDSTETTSYEEITTTPEEVTTTTSSKETTTTATTTTTTTTTTAATTTPTPKATTTTKVTTATTKATTTETTVFYNPGAVHLEQPEDIPWDVNHWHFWPGPDYYLIEPDGTKCKYVFSKEGWIYAVKSDGTASLKECLICGDYANVVVPHSIDGHKVSEYYYALFNTSVYPVESITLPGDMFYSINDLLILGTNARSIIFGEGGKQIQSRAFGGMPNCTYVKLPSTLIDIATQSFYYMDELTEIDWESAPELDTIPTQFLYHCPVLEEFKIPKGVKNIEAEFIYGCHEFKKLTVSTGPETLPPELVSFSCRKFEELIIEEGLKSIPKGLIDYTKEENFKSLTLPASLNTIGGMVCSYPISVYFNGNAPTVNGVPFWDGTTIYVKAGTTGWDSSTWSSYNIKNW